MILTCPACGTQYTVKDGAIPEGGRKVRCAACGHSWHQEPDSTGAETPQFYDAAASVEEEQQPRDVTEPVDDAPEESAAAQAYEIIEPIAPGAPLVEPPAAIPVPSEDDFLAAPAAQEVDQWDLTSDVPDAQELKALRTETPNDRKRNRTMAILLGLALVVVIAAAFWFFAPDSMRQRVGIAASGPTPLQIAPGTPERQKLASGNELVVISGRVINPSSKPQPVPPIQAQLRDKSGKVIYSWTISPPAQTLAPGDSVPFNSAEMDVPPSGLDSTVTLTLKG